MLIINHGLNFDGFVQSFFFITSIHFATSLLDRLQDAVLVKYWRVEY